MTRNKIAIKQLNNIAQITLIKIPGDIYLRGYPNKPLNFGESNKYL